MVDCHEILICKIHEKVLSGGPTQNPFCTFCIFFGYNDRGVRLDQSFHGDVFFLGVAIKEVPDTEKIKNETSKIFLGFGESVIQRFYET